ncbi:hypothetical protein D8B26_000618 [Coccidioides posadasii str. Silveira]|uniref:Mediator of RNA polymerase II transcription subunit 4 n=2 Tax=Coccidioides posadasii TaxID=199306 RepID=E9DFW8_COCPS|nr:hypothetical protein CPC735_035970 [Coccidioides posadasii C735 delta SOWgp]EER28891.1 hypothetical protein CPC735_035970 [Coccidioides posadasii C735 delta SOWgp]EFW14710.1 conserved hypothetical protein [Coccidioides posadasii str. Silveira]QVM05911.1 hypothetical protein D8B26_000618 [Coccidioides posadasii str. Silveira]|eukprot:XP_003071036.1 hypothetical protein CPC735_035970 [Coccidioides posadasii C735 delta SOWgp]
MDTALLTPLSTIEQRLNALISSITSSPTAAGALAATLALLEADDSLTSALETLRTHQANYAKILQLRAEAKSLEERVRDIVREVGKMGDDISALAGDDDKESEKDDEPVTGPRKDGEDTTMGGTATNAEQESLRRRKNEIDYKLLLDFARRISKYNTQAASAATSGAIPTKRSLQNVQEQGREQEQSLQKGTDASGMAEITKQSTIQLDASAESIRQAWLLPYPNDDKIRMGVMGKLQAAVAASGGRDDRDIEREVEKIMLAVEGGTEQTEQTSIEKENAGGGSGQAVQTSGQTAAGGIGAASIGSVAKPPAAPKAKLDLDLYDPDEDEG